jgi:hypothetical protein
MARAEPRLGRGLSRAGGGSGVHAGTVGGITAGRIARTG